MKNQVRNIILYGTLLIAGVYFFFKLLVAGKIFLIPLTIAILLAMLLVPVAERFQKWGISRGLSAFLSDLVLILFTALLFWVVGFQVKKIQEDWPKLRKEMGKKAEQIDEKLSEYSWAGNFSASEKLNQFSSGSDSTNQSNQNSGGDKANQKNNEGENSSSSSGNATTEENNLQSGSSPASSNPGQASSGSGSFIQKGWMFIKSVFGFIGSMLLVFIYIFFFLFYRSKFQKSILEFVPEEDRANANDIIKDSSRVAQQYLLGRLMLMLFLAVIYSIGFMIAGIDYAIVIAVIAAALSIIPYIGNIIGMIFAAFIALASGGSTTALIGIAITFTIAQFVESYILEPYLVGHKVNINPVMTILVVVFGEFIWGIGGMVLAIPVLAIVKVICDHIPALKPVGYTIGEEGIKDDGESGFKKLGNKIKNKFKKD